MLVISIYNCYNLYGDNMLKLDNFILEEYDENFHNNILNRLQADNNTKKYLGDLKFSIMMIKKRKLENNINKFYIAYYNKYPIGFISITYKDDEYQISYSILNKYRNQNLGSLLLQEFSEAIFERYYNVNELILKIENDNIGSKKVADLAGYNQIDNNTFTQRRKQ